MSLLGRLDASLTDFVDEGVDENEVPEDKLDLQDEHSSYFLLLWVEWECCPLND